MKLVRRILRGQIGKALMNHHYTEVVLHLKALRDPYGVYLDIACGQSKLLQYKVSHLGLFVPQIDLLFSATDLVHQSSSVLLDL